ALGGTGAERYHDWTKFASWCETFPRSKDISAARSVPLPFLPATGDQRGRAHESKHSLAAGLRRKIEITQVTRNKVGCSNCVAAGSRKRIRAKVSNTELSYCCRYSGESSFSGSGNGQRSTSQTGTTGNVSRGSTRHY